MLLEWKTAVAAAVAKGWSREETVARVSFADRCPVDIGQGYMMDYIQTLNAGSLWDKLTAPSGDGPGREAMNLDGTVSAAATASGSAVRPTAAQDGPGGQPVSGPA